MIEEPNQGEVFIAEISGISSSGNAYINTQDESNPITIGPVIPGAIGEKVKVKLVDEGIGRCLTDEIKKEGYETDWLVPECGETFTAKIDRRSGSNNGIIETRGRTHLNIGKVKEDAVGKEVKIKVINTAFGWCITKKARKHNYENRFRQMVGDDIEKIDINQDTCDSSDSEFSTSPPNKSARLTDSSTNGDSNRKANTVSDSGNIAESKSTSNSKKSEKYSPKPSEDVEDLREEAESDAVENVAKNATTTTRPTPEYTRSSKVKQYVKTRADGVCEGCGEAAPFTSKTGEPYLHAHHIYELSDGGSDTPDTVIALCPNCHYRVHHGKDGDEYNEMLEQKLSKIEN